MADHRVPLTVCPTCGYRADGASNVFNPKAVRPKSGDFSMCMSCGEILRFNDDYTMRALTYDDIKIVQSDAGLAIALSIMDKARREVFGDIPLVHQKDKDTKLQ